ncbi:hypothetical protein ABMA28_012774 [Loxostege sticticalis]|uniref:Integrase catalytic domain-containing protein n=1 Tax=Loxostege sticticalis TaxID=481309 RepID=A0ABD0S2I9_LOXSC
MSDREHLEVLQSSDLPHSSGNKCEVVERKDFDTELRKYYSGQSDKTKKPEWSADRIEQVIKAIEEFKARKIQKLSTTNQQYHYATKYDVLDVGKKRVLITKRKSVSSPVTQIIPSENYYDTLLETHLATGHGGRDKMIHALKDKKIVPQFAIKIFASLCKTCMTKKSFPKSGIVIRPLVTNDFNKRGQMDLIDLQSAPDGDFKWILNYQDHLTKFCFLRPLKSKHAHQVALELLKIFLEVGCPQILQSDNGREFTAAVIKELLSLWPTCKILNGRPRHPQSQGSVERCNQDVENMLRAWMKDNSSTNWSVGCYFVQFQKNTSLHRTIGRTPYKALFGNEPIVGLSSTYLPNSIIQKLENEEDLVRVCGHEDDATEKGNDANMNNEKHQEQENYAVEVIQTSKNVDLKQDQLIQINLTQDQMQSLNSGLILEGTLVSPTNIAEIYIPLENTMPLTGITNENNLQVENLETSGNNIIFQGDSSNSIAIVNECIPSSTTTEASNIICHICNEETSGAHTCYLCKKNVHVICGTSDKEEGYGSQILCNLCGKEKKIIEQRIKSHDNLKRAAEKMTETSSKKFKEIDINSTVLVEVPKKRNGLYRVGTSAGVIKDWLPRNALQISPGPKLNDDIPDKILSLRGASSESSPFGGQGFKMCNCSKSKVQCKSNRCACKKSNLLCTSKCHKASNCKNK